MAEAQAQEVVNSPLDTPFGNDDLDQAYKKFSNVLASEKGEIQPDLEPAAEAATEVEEEYDDSTDIDDSEEYSEEHEPQEQEEPLYQVKVDGEQFDVSLEELKNGYSRQSHFTRQSQALSEERRAFEQERSELQAQRDQVLVTLQQYQNQMPKLEEPTQEYWADLKESDPIRFITERDEFRERQMQQQQMQLQQQQLMQQQQAEEQQKFQNYVQSQRQQLTELIPEWKDPAVAKTEKQMCVEAGKKLGFSDQELNEAYDSRAIAALVKAARYDSLMEKRKGLKPVERRTAAPGSAPGEPVQLKQGKARAKLRNSGKVEDAANVFYNMIRN